jgi:hypothetical protein
LAGLRPTLHVRAPGPTGDNVPGPGSYSPTDAHRTTNPRFTLKSRHEAVDHPNTAPYRELPTMVGDCTKIALSSRHRASPPPNTPGPTYIQRSLGQDAQQSTLHGRPPLVRDPRIENPGPGAYETTAPMGNEGVKYTLKSRVSPGDARMSPGPAEYTPDYTKTKVSVPWSTMHIRPDAPKPDSTPGYLDLPSTLAGPKWIIGRRDEIDLCPA